MFKCSCLSTEPGVLGGGAVDEKEEGERSGACSVLGEERWPGARPPSLPQVLPDAPP